MPLVTINRPIGSGTVEVGQRVSQLFGISYVDRLALAEAARLAGSPVQALVEKEQRPDTFADRVHPLAASYGGH